MENSEISWTDHTHNYWVGCTKVSPACHRCYAESWAKRSGIVKWGKGEPRRLTSESNRREPLKWNKKAAAEGRRARVFCSSLADVFDAEVPTEWRAGLWGLIRETPSLDWLLLTKRPENIPGMIPSDWGDGWANVWLGATVENQAMADQRIPLLLQIPAVVRFLSCEPLLGPVNLGLLGILPKDVEPAFRPVPSRLHWVIVGGESGHGARPMAPDWARSIRDQCLEASVAFHFKQYGEWAPLETPAVRQIPMGYFEARDKGLVHNWDGKEILSTNCSIKVGKKASGRLLDGREWNEYPQPNNKRNPI